MNNMTMLAVGNGEQCPFCNEILDDRIVGKEIQKHLFTFHEKDVMDRLFPKEVKK